MHDRSTSIPIDLLRCGSSNRFDPHHPICSIPIDQIPSIPIDRFISIDQPNLLAIPINRIDPDRAVRSKSDRTASMGIDPDAQRPR